MTFVELFFDLVFVFCTTQIVGLLHDHLDWGTIGGAILVAWLVWWAWTQFTWTLNAADTDHHHIRLLTLVATAVAFFLAVGIPDSFGEGAIWFAIPYVIVRLLGLGLQVAVAEADPGQNQSAARTWAILSLAGLAAVVAGAVAGGTLQYGLWSLAIGLDLVAAALAGRREGWNLHPEHFAERHGLIVIIALGESLIVAAAGLTHAGEASVALVAIGVLAVAVTCALWWSYFPYVHPALERALAARRGAARSSLARDAYSLAYFPMLCGIIGFAVAVEAAVSHPEIPLALGLRSALAVGMVLFLGGSALAIWRATGRILVVRTALAILAGGGVVLAEVSPPISLGIVLAMLAAVLAREHRMFASGVPGQSSASAHGS